MQMKTFVSVWFVALLSLTAAAGAVERGYRQVVEGVVIYFGILPAELVRGHPREHPESEMHGGTPVGESHLAVALFDQKSGARLKNAEVRARITDDRGLEIKKKLEPMLIAGSLTYGNYFAMTHAGPHRIEVEVRLHASANPVRATFYWARS